MIASCTLPPGTSQERFRDREDGSKENIWWHAFQVSHVFNLAYDLMNLKLVMYSFK